MDAESVKLFVKHACDAFPGLLELLERSPGTLAVWGRTLSSVSLADATSVLERWIDGKLEDPPVGYKREMFALHVKSTVDRVRGDTIRWRDSQEQRAKAIRKNNGSPAYQFAFCGPFMLKVDGWNKQVVNGTLTQQERDFMVNELLEEMPN